MFLKKTHGLIPQKEKKFCFKKEKRNWKMPFKNQAQRKLLWAKDPKVAKEFEQATPKGKKLPKKVKKTKGKKK